VSVEWTVGLVCAGLGAVSVLALAAAVAVLSGAVAARPGEAAAYGTLIGGLAGLALAAAAAIAWVVLQIRLVRPLRALERAAEAVAAGAPSAGLARAEPLGGPAAAVRRLGETVARERGAVAARIGEATARLEETRHRLEAILRDLGEGVVVCNRAHEILLYNQAAARILGRPGELGLGRSLFRLVRHPPVAHAFRRLTRAGGHALIAPFACETVDRSAVLVARMTLVHVPGGAVEGYVVTFTDLAAALHGLAAHGERLRGAAEALRQPLASLRAAAETLAAHRDLDAAARAPLEAVLAEEAGAASEAFHRLDRGLAEPVIEAWPMTDIDSAELFAAVREHLGEAVALTVVGPPVVLHSDGYLLMLVIAHLARRLAPRGALDIAATVEDGQVNIDATWAGAPVPEAELEGWMAAPLAEAPGIASAAEAVARHGGIVWSQAHAEGRAHLRLRLGTGVAAGTPAEPLPPRPEFYDFDLMARATVQDAVAQRPLARLAYVVFDTETTGLRPSQGDALVSIAGVRVVNRRILSGETFVRLIDPGRPIPLVARRIHGIDDAMVRDKPPARVVLPQFKRFADDDVLVGHNVAFDMKFLALAEDESGVSFDNPVLDTLLLSVFLHGHLTEHSLDALAERFAVTVTGRHTALGDAMATAAVFLHLLDLLAARGVTTLGQAIEAQNSMVALRRRQAEF